MCGRYYVDETMANEIKKLIHDIDRRMMNGKTGEVRPSEEALVLLFQDENWQPATMRWGFLGRKGKGLLINARSETVWEKPTFQQSISEQRCVIPASGFYEWNAGKEKFTFTLPEQPVMYFAGCYRAYEAENRFVILTTAANASMAPVHERMPLLLPEENLEAWISSRKHAEALLLRKPEQLERKTEYEQLSLDLF